MTILRQPLVLVFLFLIGLALALSPGRAADPVGFGFSPKVPTTTPGSFADLAEKLLPTVVNISSTQKIVTSDDMQDMPEFPPGSPFEDFFQDFMDRHGNPQDNPQSSLGSGFVINAEEGLVVTNNHVIADAEQIRVILHDDTTLEAKLVGKDDKTDLAVLKVDPQKGKLVAATFGNSDVMRVGDWILAIGNPFGLGGTVTTGIISARARDIQSGPYDDYLQTDASINRGNSGGPMFNLRGEIIGINTAIFSPSGGSVGIGFAIPSSLAKPVIDQLIKYGRTRRGWIGVRIQSVTDDIAESLGLNDAGGALVASVSPGGPAEKAGLQPGDIITALNGTPISAMRTLPRMVAETEVDSTAELTLWRNGKDLKVPIKIAEMEKAEDEGLIDGAGTGDKKAPSAKGTTLPSVGMTLGVITAQSRDEMELPEGTNGVIVLDVKKGGEAASKGLAVGDIILEINQQAVDDPEQVAKLVAQAKDSGKTSVLLLVDTQGKGDVRFVALRLKK